MVHPVLGAFFCIQGVTHGLHVGILDLCIRMYICVSSCRCTHEHMILPFSHRDSFQRFLIPVYHWKTVEIPETNPQISWEWQYAWSSCWHLRSCIRMYLCASLCRCTHFDLWRICELVALYTCTTSIQTCICFGRVQNVKNAFLTVRVHTRLHICTHVFIHANTPLQFLFRNIISIACAAEP